MLALVHLFRQKILDSFPYHLLVQSLTDLLLCIQHLYIVFLTSITPPFHEKLENQQLHKIGLSLQKEISSHPNIVYLPIRGAGSTSLLMVRLAHDYKPSISTNTGKCSMQSMPP